MNVCWKVYSGKTHLCQGSFGNTQKVKSFLLQERLQMQQKAQHLRTIFCCSCRAVCCHFLQFNCNVAPKLHFHAYVISVFKDELMFLKDFKKVRFQFVRDALINRAPLIGLYIFQFSQIGRLVHLSVSRRGTDQQSPFDLSVELVPAPSC